MKEQSILAEDAYPIKENKLKHGAGLGKNVGPMFGGEGI